MASQASQFVNITEASFQGHAEEVYLPVAKSSPVDLETFSSVLWKILSCGRQLWTCGRRGSLLGRNYGQAFRATSCWEMTRSMLSNHADLRE